MKKPDAAEPFVKGLRFSPGNLAATDAIRFRKSQFSPGAAFFTSVSAAAANFSAILRTASSPRMAEFRKRSSSATGVFFFSSAARR